MIRIAHKKSHGTNVVVVNNQSVNSKTAANLFYCPVISCSQQQHSFRGISCGLWSYHILLGRSFGNAAKQFTRIRSHEWLLFPAPNFLSSCQNDKFDFNDIAHFNQLNINKCLRARQRHVQFICQNKLLFAFSLRSKLLFSF